MSWTPLFGCERQEKSEPELLVCLAPSCISIPTNIYGNQRSLKSWILWRRFFLIAARKDKTEGLTIRLIRSALRYSNDEQREEGHLEHWAITRSERAEQK